MTFFELESGHQVFVEVKLAERAFGSCPDDEVHRRKWQHVYLPRLQSKLKESALDAEAIFGSYQLARNLAYAGEDTTVVFLMPRANKGLWDHAHQYLEEAVLPSTLRGVRLQAAEDLLRSVSSRTDLDPLLHTCISSIAEKYLPGET